MDNPSETLPDDVDALKAAVLSAAAHARRIEAELANARARAFDDQAIIAHQQLQIAKLRHQLYGQRSERGQRLLDQLALAFDELESSATADEIAAEQAAAHTINVAPFARRRPARQPFPAHLPRERVVEPAPSHCLCCGSARLRKLGEDDGNAGGDPAPLEGHPARAGEILMPRLREGEPGASAVPCDGARMGGAQPAGHGSVREIRPAPAAEPPG